MSPKPRIEELRIAASPDAWRACGFEVGGDGVALVGSTSIRFVEDGRGIAGWTLRDVANSELDGLPTELVDSHLPEPRGEAAEHPVGAVAVDHIVAFSDDLARTTAALEAAGIELRRVREPDEPGPPLRQAFFRLGEAILEVVEGGEGGNARFWGLTFGVADIDAAAALLGERLGAVGTAVQPGRRIATVRGEAGLGLPVALISPAN